MYLYSSEKCFEHCGQRSERAGLLLGPLDGVWLLPLDIESRGDADKVGVTSPIGSGEESFIVEDSGKAKGSDGQEPGMVDGRCSDSEGVLLLPLDVESRGDAEKVVCPPPVGGEGYKYSVKAKGSDGPKPGKVEGECSYSPGSVKAKGSEGQRP